MQQIIHVEGWKDVDVYEVIQAMPPYSKIMQAEQSRDAIELEEFSEFVSRRVH